MDCPRCQENLRQAQRMGVEIDYCPRCRGVWLDGGELEKLMERSQGYDIFPQESYQNSSRGGYEHREREYHGERHPKKKKGFFGELLDLFG